MSTTVRAVRDDVANAVDFLSSASLTLFSNPIVIQGSRVTWRSPYSAGPFITSKSNTDMPQLRSWLVNGEYTCVLFDGSLLQITYDIGGGEVVGHRLAYIPCPVKLDQSLLREEPILDVIDIYLEDPRENVVLLSPIRFDFDRVVDRTDHPGAHFTINTSDCRVACVAPLHIGRFLDFVFSHFYPVQRKLWSDYFDEAGRSNLESVTTMTVEHRRRLHIAWEWDNLGL